MAGRSASLLVSLCWLLSAHGTYALTAMETDALRRAILFAKRTSEESLLEADGMGSHHGLGHIAGHGRRLQRARETPTRPSTSPCPCYEDPLAMTGPVCTASRKEYSSACAAECAGERAFRIGPCAQASGRPNAPVQECSPSIEMSMQSSVGVMGTTVYSFQVEVKGSKPLGSWEMELIFDKEDTISSVVADTMNGAEDEHEIDFEGTDGEFTLSGRTKSSSTAFSFFAVGQPSASADEVGVVQSLMFNDDICKMDASGIYRCCTKYSSQEETIAVVYGDSLVPEWTTSTVSATLKQGAKPPTQSAGHESPMLVNFQSGGRVDLKRRSPFSGNANSLEMWTYAMGKASLRVSLAASKRESKPVLLSNAVEAKKWVKVSIPLSAFGGKDSTWDTISISNPLTQSSKVYLDNVILVEAIARPTQGSGPVRPTARPPARPAARPMASSGERALEDPLKGCQVFSNESPMQIPDSGSMKSSIILKAVPAYPVTKVQVSLVHSYVGTLELSLRSPRGYAVGLAKQAGGTGANMVKTTFSSVGKKPLPTGAGAESEAPFTAEYMPVQQNSLDIFTAVERKDTSSGHEWVLRINDVDGDGKTGTLLNWRVGFCPDSTVSGQSSTASPSSDTSEPGVVTAAFFAPIPKDPNAPTGCNTATASCAHVMGHLGRSNRVLSRMLMCYQLEEPAGTQLASQSWIKVIPTNPDQGVARVRISLEKEAEDGTWDMVGSTTATSEEDKFFHSIASTPAGGKYRYLATILQGEASFQGWIQRDEGWLTCPELMY